MPGIHPGEKIRDFIIARRHAFAASHNNQLPTHVALSAAMYAAIIDAAAEPPVFFRDSPRPRRVAGMEVLIAESLTEPKVCTLYEPAKPKPRPALRCTTCGKAPKYFEEEHGTTICCPDSECECDFVHEATPERAVKVWNEDWSLED